MLLNTEKRKKTIFNKKFPLKQIERSKVYFNLKNISSKS